MFISPIFCTQNTKNFVVRFPAKNPGWWLAEGQQNGRGAIRFAFVVSDDDQQRQMPMPPKGFAATDCSTFDPGEDIYTEFEGNWPEISNDGTWQTKKWYLLYFFTWYYYFKFGKSSKQTNVVVVLCRCAKMLKMEVIKTNIFY